MGTQVPERSAQPYFAATDVAAGRPLRCAVGSRRRRAVARSKPSATGAVRTTTPSTGARWSRWPSGNVTRTSATPGGTCATSTQRGSPSATPDHAAGGDDRPGPHLVVAEPAHLPDRGVGPHPDVELTGRYARPARPAAPVTVVAEPAYRLARTSSCGAVGCRPHEDGRRRSVRGVPARLASETTRASRRCWRRRAVHAVALVRRLRRTTDRVDHGQRGVVGHGDPRRRWWVSSDRRPRRRSGADSSSERDATRRAAGRRRRRAAGTQRRGEHRSGGGPAADAAVEVGPVGVGDTVGGVARPSWSRRGHGGARRPARPRRIGSLLGLIVRSARAGGPARGAAASPPSRSGTRAPRPPPAPTGRRSSGAPPRVRWRTGSRASASSSSRASRSATGTSSVAWWRRSRTRRRRWDRQALTTARRA